MTGLQRGKSVRIYFAPDGVRHAEVVGWTGQALACSRRQIESLKNWKTELSKPGVYFLLGSDERELMAYIGESDNIIERLKSHISKKDFWNQVVAFTSKDVHLTKAHVEYIEHRLIQEARSAKRYKLDNGNDPNAPTLPRADRDVLDDYIDNLKILLSALGPRILDPMISVPPSLASAVLPGTGAVTEELFALATKGCSARGRRTNDGFAVLKDSLARLEVTRSFLGGYATLRNRLLAQGVLVPASSTGALMFSEDVVFSSSSAAACVVAGSPRNGRDAWRLADGRSLGALEDAEASELLPPGQREGESLTSEADLNADTGLAADMST